jgi:hypothetical protein
MISRDTDSRLNSRESNAVNQWLKSNKDFHIMRDHPYHNTEILGGMWGVRNGLLSDIKDDIKKYVKGDFWQVDQNFLKEIVYPKVKNFQQIEKINILWVRRLMKKTYHYILNTCYNYNYENLQTNTRKT